MTSQPEDRTADTVLSTALLLLVFHALWELFDGLGRGRFVTDVTSLALFGLLLVAGLIGRRPPRPHPRLALLGVVLLFLALMIFGNLAPGMPRTEPSSRDIARVILTRYLLAFEWSALFLALAWQYRPPASSSRAEAAGPGEPPVRAGRSIPPFRIRGGAIVVIASSLVAGAAFVMAGKQAGTGPVGPAAAVILFAVGLATAAACQNLESDPDA